MRKGTSAVYSLGFAGLLTAAILFSACSKSGSTDAASSDQAQGPRAAKLGTWTDDYAAAVKQAKAENKQILLDFTGSDWCPNCWNLDDGVFSKQAFADYAKAHLVLVTLDFPSPKIKLPDQLVQQNELLMNKYGVEGLPTEILLDSNEKKLAEIVGYGGETPAQFIDKLEHPVATGS